MDRHENSWFAMPGTNTSVIMCIVPIDLKYTVIFIIYTCTEKYMCIQGILNLILLYNDQITYIPSCLKALVFTQGLFSR